MCTFLSALKPFRYGQLIRIFLAIVVPCCIVSAQPSLVKDIVSASEDFSGPQSLISVKGILYFSAESGEFGRELWRSDGTKAGTYLVKDITPGLEDSSPESMVNLNGTLYFIANKKILYNYYQQGTDKKNTFELWRSDGTLEGTKKVAEFPLGYLSWAEEMIPVRLITAGNSLYFTVNNYDKSYELWKSDGTTAGSSKVTGVSVPDDVYESLFIGAGNYVYYTSNNPSHSLWRTDGTPQGTIVLQTSYTTISQLMAVNNVVFFNAEDIALGNGNELWKTDGTKAGTLLVKDITPAPGYPSDPALLFHINGTLYFTANGEGSSRDLLKTDGTAAGTVVVKTNIGIPFSTSSTVINSIAYFVSYSPQTGDELWRTNGTSAGTYMVKDIYAGATSSEISYLTNVNGTLYFAATAPGTGRDVWKSNGTAAGTVIVKDIPNGPGNFSPYGLTNVNDTLYFVAEGGLWKSNGTAAGTIQVESNMPPSGSLGSFPANLTAVNGTAFFTREIYPDVELWKSNGTATGTLLIKTIKGVPGANRSAGRLTAVNSLLYFVVSYSQEGKTVNEVWKSNGTEASTVLVKTFPATASAFVLNLIHVNGSLYFTYQLGSTSGAKSQVWKSNGTPEGTIFLKEFNGTLTSRDFIAINSTFYFRANDGLTGNELWKSNGTPAGTVLVKDIVPGSEESYPAHLTNLNGVLYFFNSKTSSLWKSDGTAAGTVQISNLAGSGVSSEIVTSNGTMYFTAYDNTNGTEIWKSNGTTAGTVVIKKLGEQTFVGNLALVNSTLYFTTYVDEFSGVPSFPKLWKSNGTEAGTLAIKDIEAYRLIAVGNSLIFASENKLWRSKGTPENTGQVATLNVELLSSYAVVNNTLYFMADDSKTGFELWKYDTEACNEVTNKNPILLGSTVCSGENGSITIQSTQTGIFYQTYINDSPVGSQVQGGGNIKLTIPAVSLSAGANAFTIKASGCVLTNLTSKAIVTVNECATACSASGTILQEVWLNVPGSLVSDIPLNTSPSSTKQLTSFEAPTNAGTNYGQRIRGYLCVPASGNYTFYIAGDDRGELWLSTDENPSKKVKIASVPYYTAVREWTKYPAQKAVAIPLVAGKKYYIEALHKEGSYADHIAVGWQTASTAPIQVIPGSVLSPYVAPLTGKISRELWTNVPGSAVSDIPLNTTPNTVGTLTSFEAPSNAGNNYGQRIRGYVHPTVSGTYRFYLAGDDKCELWLSSDEDPGKKTKIAAVNYFAGVREWTKYPSQKSAAISLVAGKKYYIEALHKEGLYGDNLAVGWALPGQTSISVIAGSFLSPYLPSANIARKGVENTETDADQAISVYPNPFDTKLTISSTQQGSLHIRLTDNLGRTLYQVTKPATSPEINFDLSGLQLKSGVYFISFTREHGQTHVVKIIKR